jgi:hypothetical protein
MDQLDKSAGCHYSISMNSTMNGSSQAYAALAGVSGLAAQAGSRPSFSSPTRSITKAAASSRPMTLPSGKVWVR